MKAILALGAALALSGCAYYDPYVSNAPYYGNAPYAVAPQPYYGAVVPYGYGAYGYGFGGYDYPNVYGSYPAYPWVGPGRHLHPRPDDGSGRRPSPPGRSPEGSGSGWEPGGGGGNTAAPGGGGSGWAPNQPPAK